MGFLKPSLRRNITTPAQIFSILLPVIIFLLFSVPSSSSSSSSSEDQNTPAPTTATYYRVFYTKNATPYFLKNQEAQQWRRYKSLVESKNKKTRKKTRRGSMNADTRAFTTMLPKGFIPPSGSSPCHNDFPNSITFFCQLSSQKP